VQRKALVFLSLAMLAAVVAAYLPALEAGFVWNDDTYLTENRTLDTLDGLHLIWTEPKANEQYYPMVFTSFWIEKHLWSLHPFGYHLVNVLLHAGSALLLWRLLVRLSLPGAWLAAAVFALHPVCVESVAWVTERKNTLSLLLSLLAMLAYLIALERREQEKTGRFLRKGKRRRPAAAPAARTGALSFAAFLFFLLALLAKTTAVVVSAVLLVLVWLRRGKIAGRDVGPIVPWFAAGIALAAHTAWLERTMVQAAGREWSLSFPGRIVLAGQTTAFYAAKLVAPTKLAFVYERWHVDPSVPSQWLPAASAVAATAAAWFLRRRVGRGPLAGLLLFFGVLFPAMGFFNVYAMRYSWVADHFAYQAAAVFAACAVCGAASWVVPRGAAVRRAIATLAVAALALFGTLTFRHSRTFHDLETLWRDTLERSPGCFMCHTNYGNWLMENGRDAEAVLHFEKSLTLRSDNVPTLLNLARIEESHDRLDAAAARLRTALKIDPADTAVLINLGTVNTKAGRVDEAVTSYEEALRLGSPEDYLAHNGLGVALMRRGSAAEAVEHFLRPDYEFARANLERALSASNGPRVARP
jgi:tetratricopeptide (TPR) repeat protein